MSARWTCHLARQQDLTQRNPLETPCLSSLCFIISVIMVLFNFLFVLCCFYLCYVPLFYYFPSHSPRKQGPDAVRIIKSGQTSWIPEYKIRNTSVSFWSVTFLQWFEWLVGCLMIFARFRLFNTFYLTVIKTYNWFKAIKSRGWQWVSIGQSTIVPIPIPEPIPSWVISLVPVPIPYGYLSVGPAPITRIFTTTKIINNKKYHNIIKIWYKIC